MRTLDPCGMLAVLLSVSPGAPAVDAGATRTPAFSQPWMNGTHGPEPQLQVQQYDAATYILRQSVKTNVEAPFLFLFFGADRVLLVDTGAGGLQIRPTLEALIEQWRQSHESKPLELVVVHTHAHGDHIAGDAEFTGRPATRVAGHKPEDVAEFFKIRSWPTDIVPFDLGGRVLDIIPAPGHEPSEIALFDRQTHLLLTGDELYPGRLYVHAEQFDAYRATIDRIVDFTRSRHVAWILGNHIEMTRKAGQDYPMHAPDHPDERPLELPYSSLLELQRAVHAMSEPRLSIHPSFIIYPVP